DSEIEALRTGIDLGMSLVDTAEMYGNGAAEELLGRALRDRREEVFLVDKVLPSNASKKDTIAACERSLRRLNTDRIDLYLLHWRGPTPLAETVEAFQQLQQDGRIRHWGVSNFDHDEMSDLFEVPGGTAVAANQVLYNLTRRGPEYDPLPWCRDNRLPVMAYSPIEQARMLDHTALREVAERHGVSPARVGLAWVLRHDEMCTIPRASTPEHVRDNHAALQLRLTSEDHETLDAAFPPPAGPRPLEIL